MPAASSVSTNPHQKAEVNPKQVSVLSVLYDKSVNAFTECSSWKAAREAAYGTKTSATVDGEDVDSAIMKFHERA